MAARIMIMCLTAVLAMGSAVQASVYNVSPGQSIQAAINAAASGDTINVAAGTYNENLTIAATKDNLVLQGAGSATTNIYVTGSYGISIYADGVTFDGFTVTQNAAATVQKALALMGGATGNTVSNSVFVGTGSTKSGSMGILVRDSDNTIDTVESYGWHGYGIDVYSGNSSGPYADNVLIQNSRFHDNGWFDVAVDRSTNVTVQNCILTGGAPASSGIAFFATASGTVTGGRAAGCTISGYPSNNGVLLVGDGVLVDDNDISGCYASIRVTTSYWPYVTADNNTITNNDLHHSTYGVLIDHGTNPEPTGNVFHNNTIRDNTVGFDATDLSTWVDATNNFWGDPTGPSGGLADPVTSALATGLGDSVTANVHWDPYTVPEPATMGLLALGGLGAIIRRRRAVK